MHVLQRKFQTQSFADQVTEFSGRSQAKIKLVKANLRAVKGDTAAAQAVQQPGVPSTVPASGPRTNATKRSDTMTTRAISMMPAAPRGAIGRSFIGRLIATAKRWWLAYMIWRIQRTAADQLWSMSDRMLWDMGLTRGDILRAVKGELARERASRR